MDDCDVGPWDVKCRGIESKHISELGDVYEPAEGLPAPNTPDALALHALVEQLGVMEQYCLVARIMRMIGLPDEYPAVFRMRRVGDYAMEKLADNAEDMLVEMMRKSA